MVRQPAGSERDQPVDGDAPVAADGKVLGFNPERGAWYRMWG